MYRRAQHWGWLGILLLGLAVSTVQAADQRSERGSDRSGDQKNEKTPEKLRFFEEDLGKLSTNLEDLRRNFTNRSGLIGVTEARKRYEEAVYKFLTGSFEPAAMEFFILVQSKSLATMELAQDAEWYLGESLFQLENYRTATESFRSIIEKGPGHPYFSDAVVRSLEAFAILGDTARFDSYYNAYILTGKVKTNELINYTLAKSFRLRGEIARSRGVLEGFSADSPYYSRARYFLGVYSIQEARAQKDANLYKQYLKQAEAEFQRVIATKVSDEAQQEVQDLAWLGLGSLSYEMGEYPKATEYYAKISSTSPLYADQLYQGVWSFIKQERFDEALDQITVFLTQYPDHRYSAALRILQGKLLMKLSRYDEALLSFDEVVNTYQPIVDRMDRLVSGELELRPYLNRSLDETAPDPGGMPSYALDLLYSADPVHRAVEAWQTLQSERQELEDAERTLREIDLALSSSGNTLGSFTTARGQLTSSQANLLVMRTQLIEQEVNYLRSRVPSASRQDLSSLLTERQLLMQSLAAAGGASSQDADRLQVYDEQVREVQIRAERLLYQVTEAEASARSTLSQLDAGNSTLDAQATRETRAKLLAQQQELADLRLRLEDMQGEAMRRKVMRTVEVAAGPVDTGAARAQLIARLDSLRQKVAGYRRYATGVDDTAFFSAIDRLYGQLDSAERTAASASGVLATSEKQEMTMVLSLLELQRKRVADLRSDILVRGTQTEQLALEILQDGLEDTRDQFRSSVLIADKGVVDVYWVRKQQLAENMEALLIEQSKVMEEMRLQYRIIEESLER